MSEIETQVSANDGVFRDIDFTRKSRPVMPALDFLPEQDLALVSVPLFARTTSGMTAGSMQEPKAYSVVVSAGQRLCVPTDELPLRIGAMPTFVDQDSRWREEELRLFLQGTYPIPTPAELLTRIAMMFEKYLDVPKIETKVLAAWTLGTYLHPLWPAYGLLVVNGPFGSGKSRVLTLLGQMALQPISLANCTAAAVFRACNRATVCIDEAETLGGTNASQRELKLILQASYRQEGGEVIRCAGPGRLARWPVFGPKAIAAINEMDSTLASRSIIIKMHRSMDSSKTTLRLDNSSEDWAAFRADMYAVALTAWRQVIEARPNTGVLMARRLEVYLPLLQIAQWVDPTGVLAGELANYGALSGGTPIKPVALSNEERKIAQALASLPGSGAEQWLNSAQIHAAVVQRFPELVTLSTATIGLSLAKHKLWAERRHTPQGKMYRLDVQRAAVLAAQP